MICTSITQSQSQITTDSQSASLGVRHPSGTRDQFFLLLEIFFRQLSVCYFVAPSLTRGRVCNLLLLLVLASAVPLGSESQRTQDHILLSQFLRLPQPGEPGPRIYIPQEQGGPVIPPGTGFPFRRLLRLAGLRQRYSIPPPHGIYVLLILAAVDMTALTWASSDWKLQTHPLVCGGDPHNQPPNCLTVAKISSLAPDATWHQDWPTIGRNMTLIVTLTSATLLCVEQWCN
jgi:hypothetical protein